MELLDQKQLAEWRAYYHLKEKQEQVKEDQRAIATATLIASLMSGTDVDIETLFPNIEFTEEDDVTVESSKACFASALRGVMI